MQKAIKERVEKRFKKVKRLLILGVFGVEGKSFLSFYEQFLGDKKVSLFDDRQFERLSKVSFGFPIEERYGDINDIDFSKYDMVIRSPGFPKKNIPKDFWPKIVNNMGLFMDFVDLKNVYGITGTKGKGTTSTILYHLLAGLGEDVVIGGNIGIGVLDLLNCLKEKTKVVLEVSSFQAQDLNASPHQAVILKTNLDHLDKHEGEKDYHDSKANLLRFQKESDLCVYFLDDDNSGKIANESEAKKAVYSFSETKLDVSKMIFDKENHVLYFTEGDINKMITLESFKLPGEHNLENLMAALLVCKDLWKDFDDERIRKMMGSLDEFWGLPMHTEKVAEINGITVINDSYSTTPITSMAAIKSFGDNIILVLGGELHMDISEYRNLFDFIKNKNVKQCVLFAKNIEPFEEGLRSRDYHQITSASTMDDLVRVCFDVASFGDTILFSPGAKSFDLFRNFKDRGDQFNRSLKRFLQSYH